MSNETPHEKAVDRAHRMLIERIIDGSYPSGSELPGERWLSKDLGVARNGLREALQRLSHDGWIEINQGKPTRVRDYLRDGNLNILIDLLNLETLPNATFVPDLMRMWSVMAHDYTANAVQREPIRIAERLHLYKSLADSPEACAQAMWQLHRALIDYGGNRIYGLVLNSFAGFYERFALGYFADATQRSRVRQLWETLLEAARAHNAPHAADAMHTYILQDAEFWTQQRVPLNGNRPTESD